MVRLLRLPFQGLDMFIHYTETKEPIFAVMRWMEVAEAKVRMVESSVM